MSATRERSRPARGRRAPRPESSYPTRRVHGAKFFTSRDNYGDLTLVVKRFPGPSAGTASPRPFVLVHGIGVSSRYFHPLAAALARLGAVWVVDLPGYGASPKAGRHVTLDDHADVLAAFLDRAGIDDPVLVGHSMGTQVVSVAALRHPGITDRLALLGPTTDDRRRTVAQQAWSLLVEMVMAPWRAKWVVGSDYLFRCGIPYYLRQLPNLIDDRPEDRMPRHDMPVLVVRGDRDPICPPRWTRHLASLAPQGRHAEVRGPHVVMFTDPGRTAELLLEHAR